MFSNLSNLPLGAAASGNCLPGCGNAGPHRLISRRYIGLPSRPRNRHVLLSPSILRPSPPTLAATSLVDSHGVQPTIVSSASPVYRLYRLNEG